MDLTVDKSLCFHSRTLPVFENSPEHDLENQVRPRVTYSPAEYECVK